MANNEDVRVRHLLGTLEHLNGDSGGKAHDGPVGEALRAARAGVTAASPVAVLAARGAEPVTLATGPAATGASPIWGKRTLLGASDMKLVGLRRGWTIDRIPRFEIEPAPTQGPPRREGDYLLWNSPDRHCIYFALAVPRLRDVMVTIRRESVDNTIKITGGSVTLTVSAYDLIGPRAAQQLQDHWLEVMTEKKPAGVARPGRPVVVDATLDPAVPARSLARPAKLLLPSYQPLVLRSLEASLETDPKLLAGAVSVTTSPDVGTVTFVIPLSELGAQAWKDALEQRRGDLIAGLCSLAARYYATSGSQLTVAPIQLSAPLGQLLAGLGPEIMQVLNAQLTVDARVIVSGHQTLQTVTVDWGPSEGHAPEALMFGADGGSWNGPITSQDIGRVTIDWSAQVRYQPWNWPVVHRSGRLSFAEGNWTLLLKPESWVAEYSLFVVLLDGAGNPVPQGANAGDANHRVQCEVRFTAPFLEGGAAIATTFETTSQTLTRLAFPLPPGESPGEVKLTVFAQRGGAPQVKARLVQPSETFILITVQANAAIDITVNAPEGGETLEGTLLALAAQLG